MKSTSVLFDTNVIIDFLERRGGFSDASERLFTMCADGIIKGFIATQSVSDIFYILRKDYTATQRRELLRNVCAILEIVDIGKRHILSALSDDTFSDLEDGILAKCAEDYDFDFIASRNTEDFTTSKIPAVTPLGLLNLLQNQETH